MSTNCYGRPARESNTDQDDRLTTKHIKTLTLLKDLATENKGLKCRIKELEECTANCKEIHAKAEENQERLQELQVQYLARLDENNKTLTEKHRNELMQKVEEKIALEKQWASERKTLIDEIDRLKTEIQRLECELKETLPYKYKCENLDAKVESLQGELQEMQLEKSRMLEAHENQLQEIQRLHSIQSEKSSLLAELQEALQKNKELQFRYDRAQRDLNDSGYTKQEELMTVLKNKLTKLHKDKNTWDEKEGNLNIDIKELKDEIGKLRRALQDSERMRQDMHAQMGELSQELYLLHKTSVGMNDNRTFKEFVQIKRDLVQVREENEELKAKLMIRGKSNSLPSIKKGQMQSNFSEKVTTRINSASIKGRGTSYLSGKEVGKM